MGGGGGVDFPEWPDGKAPAKRGTFFRLHIQKGGDFMSVEVYERVGKIVILVSKGQMRFMAARK